MGWTPEMVISALVVLGTVGGGSWTLGRRNGRNGGCPDTPQKAHGERLATLETLSRTQGREIGEIKTDVKTLLGRLPAP